MIARAAGLALVLVGVGILAVSYRTALGGPAEPGEPYAEAQVPGQPRLRLEVAASEPERERGLMFRESLPDDQGMLFVFAQDVQVGFWMRNTLIPLSIAYVAADGRIIDIFDMDPVPGPGFTPFKLPDGSVQPIRDGQPAPPGAVWQTYQPRGSYRYAIETNRGWFARAGVAVGDRAEVLSAAQEGARAQPPPICRERGV